MSFFGQPTIFDEPVSGEARSFDPFIVLPGGGLRQGVSAIPKIGKSIFDDIARAFKPSPFPGVARGFISTGKSNLDVFRNLRMAKPAPAVTKVTPQETILANVPQKSFGLSKSVTATAIAGSTAITALSLPIGQGGQSAIQTATDISKTATQFLQKNPYILPAILIIGAILVIKK